MGLVLILRRYGGRSGTIFHFLMPESPFPLASPFVLPWKHMPPETNGGYKRTATVRFRTATQCVQALINCVTTHYLLAPALRQTEQVKQLLC